jgi:hypothetical protein
MIVSRHYQTAFRLSFKRRDGSLGCGQLGYRPAGVLGPAVHIAAGEADVIVERSRQLCGAAADPTNHEEWSAVSVAV